MIAVGGTSQNGTFEEIRDFEALSEKTQKPLPDYAESGMLSYFAGDRAKKRSASTHEMRVEALDWLPRLDLNQ